MLPGSRRLRSRGPLRALAVGLGAGSLALGVVLSPLDAAGQRTKPKPTAAPAAAHDAGDRYDPDNITAMSQFMETAVKGNERYHAKDYTGAIDLFKKAIQFNPRNALGPYLLGEAYLALGNLPEAEAAFKTAEDLASDPKAPQLRSQILFAVADVYERQKKWEQARTSWQTYTEHAAKLGPDGGSYPQSGAARIKAIDDALKLDKQYEIVRQRIAAEKADSGADAGKPAAPKK